MRAAAIRDVVRRAVAVAWHRRRPGPGPGGAAPLVMIALTLGFGPIAAGSDHPEPATRLELRASSSREWLHWSARDRSFVLPAADPRALGATLEVSGIDQTFTFDLPAARWSLDGKNTRIRFRGDAADYRALVPSVVLRLGRGLSMRARSAGIALDDPAQQHVSIALVIGGDRYCARCTAPRTDGPGHFAARDCPAPVLCADGTVTTSLPTTTTTTTTLTSTTSPTTSTTTTTICTRLLEWGGFGSDPGQFWNAVGVAVSSDGQRVYTLDLGNNRLQVFDADAHFLTEWGGPGAGPGQFQTPIGIALGPTGDVYVADAGNRRIQRFTGDGDFVQSWGAAGSADGAFDAPTGVTVDAAGDVYVADIRNHRIQKFDADGNFITKWLTLHPEPAYVAADGSRWIYVLDQFAAQLERFTTAGALVDTPIMVPGDHGALAVDARGRVYHGTPAVRRSDLSGGGTGDLLWVGEFVTGIAPAPDDVVYLSDYSRCSIVKLSCP